MSKTKQKPIDELLKEALVPEDEQPYQVPENWVWVRLGSFLPPMETRDPAKLESDSFLYVDIDSIDNHKCEIREPKEIAIKEAPSRAKRAIDKGDVIISLVRPYLKNVARVLFDNPFLVASTAFYVCKRNKVTETDYLYYYLITSFVTNYLNVRAKGHNAPSVRNDDFLRVPIPIPPLNEQKRIVDKIERLFAKIDEAKRLIEEVKESVELRRAAILDRAFRGELGTNDHFEAPNQINEKEIVPPNEQPYKVPENWVWVKLKSCLKNLQYGYTASSSASEEGPKYLRITDIQNSRVDWEKVPHCKIDPHAEKNSAPSEG